MIGYYVHHHGSGHLHRALAVNQAYGAMTGLSTQPRPAGWRGDWVVLPDDAGAADDGDLTASGRLHYVPLGWSGLSTRMSVISGWLAASAPTALVVDVSVEVALLARLHGVRVVTVAQPGSRTDPAHRLGYDVASTILAPWPAAFGGLWGASEADLAKTRFVGPVSRVPVDPGTPVRRRVVVLNGTGGDGPTALDVAAARRAAPDWEWIHLDARHGTWVADPHELLRSAEVVITHAGQNAIAEVAAVRRPALVLPQARPFDEQTAMAAALGGADLPVRTLDHWPEAPRWPQLLAEVAQLRGEDWRGWYDGAGATRMAAVLRELGGGSAVAEAATPAVAVPA